MSQLNKNYTFLSQSIFINSALFVMLLYFITIYRFAINQPAGDDYDAILYFLNQYSSANPLEQFFLFVQQHNEHRILFTRLITIVDLKLFGNINFIHLIWVGNFGWILSIAGFWMFTKKYTNHLLEFSPAAILLLSFSHFDMMTWAMTSISQYWQVCFSIFAIGLMVANHFISSQLAFSAALFTSGGGVALVPIFSAYYLFQKKWREFFLNFIFAISLLAIYFWLLPYNAPPSSRILEALQHPFIFFGYILGFIGGLGNNLSVGLPSILICGSLLIFLFIAKLKFIYSTTPFLFWLVAYIFVTAVLAALNRSILGVISSGDSRYSEFSLLFAASLYLIYLASSTGTQRTKTQWIGFLIAITAFTYWYEQAKQPLIDRRYWLENRLQTHPNWSNSQEIKRQSIEQGIFKE